MDKIPVNSQIWRCVQHITVKVDTCQPEGTEHVNLWEKKALTFKPNFLLTIMWFL